MTGLIPRPDRPCGDALVVATRGMYRWVLLAQKKSGEWAVPGGKPEPQDRSPFDTAMRELFEETGVDGRRYLWAPGVPMWVPDGRFEGGGVDGVLFVADLGRVTDLPHVRGEAGRGARWFQGGTFGLLERQAGDVGGLFGPHRNMLADVLGGFDGGVDT